MARRLVLPLVALALVGCGASSTGVSAPEGDDVVVRDGVALTLPSGWHAAEGSLTPKLVDPRELVSVGTFPMRVGGACNQLPSRAYSEMGPRDAIVTLMARNRSRNPYRERPGRFRLTASSGGFECAPPDLQAQQFSFSDAGRNLYFFVALGPDGPEAELEAVLNSLSVEPLG